VDVDDSVWIKARIGHHRLPKAARLTNTPYRVGLLLQHLVDGKFPPRSQGRMPPQGSPFAAFSGMPLAAIAEQGAKTVQMPTGSQRPIIVLKLVG
jgi:hypothetical protein